MNNVQTENRQLLALEARSVVVGAVSGVLGGVGMGLVLQLGTDMLSLLGAFLGETSAVLGWVVHLFVSVVYGVLFAVVVAYPPVQSFLADFDWQEYVLVGVTYAIMIAAVTIGILPFVFDLPWETAATRAPFSVAPSPGLEGLLPSALFAFGHVVYGGILGGVYARLGDRADEAEA